MAKLVKPKTSNDVISESMVDNLVQEYSVLSSQIKKLEERKKYLAGVIKTYALQHGTKDDKGSYYCENTSFVYGLVAKYKTIPRENIISILKEIGREDCIDTVEIVNMKKIDDYHNEGILSDDNIMNLFEVKEITPSVSVIEKKELTTVEKTTAKKATGKK